MTPLTDAERSELTALLATGNPLPAKWLHRLFPNGRKPESVGRCREETLRSGYVYQIYAYLRSQVGRGDSLADHASGLLLHPSVGEEVDETVVIQGHRIRFATVDLTASAAEIRSRLLRLCESTLQ